MNRSGFDGDSGLSRVDIATAEEADLEASFEESDARFTEFFTAGNRDRLSPLSMGFVVTQQSLRASVVDVFKRAPKTSLDEVGSTHTVQGYDLNHAGVVIEPDLKFDIHRRWIVFDRANYFDFKGKENNPRLGLKFTDEDLLEYVTNIYGVLLTRGIKGTYVYVCDPDLREYLAPYFTAAGTSRSRTDVGVAPARTVDVPAPGGQDRKVVQESSVQQ